MAVSVDWTESYSVRYRLNRVDPDTWATGDEIGGVYEGKIERNGDDDVPMLESATATVDMLPGESFTPGYYRMDALVRQGGYSRIELGTFWMMETASQMDYNGLAAHSVTGYSVLRPADLALITAGAYAPMGANGPLWVKNFLSQVVKAPIAVEGDGFTLNKNLVFSAGDTYLSCAWAVLDAGNWIMQIDGMGKITICAKPTEPAIELTKPNSSVLQPKVQKAFDLTGVPNVYVANNPDNDETVTVENDDSDSDTSVPVLGMRSMEYDSSPELVNGETLYQYAIRKLREASTVPLTFSYEREYDADSRPFDIVRGSLQERELDGDYTILTQSITLGKGISVNEKIGTNVKEWKV